MLSISIVKDMNSDHTNQLHKLILILIGILLGYLTVGFTKYLISVSELSDIITSLIVILFIFFILYLYVMIWAVWMNTREKNNQ